MEYINSREEDRKELSTYLDNDLDIDILLSIKYDLSPDQFEHRVANYYHDVEWYDTIVQWWYDDEWVDVIATKSGYPTLYIQCKKYIKWHISLKDIWYFYGLVTDQTDENIQMVYIATTRITQNAKKFAKSKWIILKNYRDIVKMAHKLNPPKEKNIDIDLASDDVYISENTAIADWTGPQTSRLQSEISALMNILANEKLNLESLERVLYIFKLDYQKVISPYYIQKMEIDSEIMNIRSKSAKLNDIIKEMDYEPLEIDKIEVDRQKQYYKEQMQEQIKIENKKSKLNEEENINIKKLYKKLMMKFHPDKYALKPELISISTQIAQEINEAYSNFDLNKLLDIQAKHINWIDDDGQYNAIPIWDLISHKNNLESEIIDTQYKYKNIKNTELYIMYQEYINYVNLGKDFFEKLIDEIREEIYIAKNVLEKLKNETNL